MFIFGGSTPLWLVNNVLSGCGLFSCGSNVFDGSGGLHRPYKYIVGSRTIIGYILPLLD